MEVRHDEIASRLLFLLQRFGGALLGRQCSDTSVWGMGDWLLGRTTLGNPPTFGQEADTSFVSLSHDTYNPNDPGGTFRGAELLSLSQFTIGAGKEFEARVRVSSETRGLVMSFFSWGARGTNSRTWETDEIDF